MIRLEALMIGVQIGKMLEQRGKSFYWLAKEANIQYATLWRLENGKGGGIRFDTLDRICEALDCEPGDILVRTGGRRKQKGKE
jgi:putative transcriptional regulator